MLAMLLALPLVQPAPARSDWVSPFEQAGFDGPVYDLCVFNDQLIVAGAFMHVEGRRFRNVVAFDGEDWHALGAGVGLEGRFDLGNSWAEVMTVYKGELLVGGKFDEAGTEPASFVARWDGEAWHAMADGMNARVSALETVNQSLYLGGFFRLASDVPVNYVTRYNGRFNSLGGGMQGPVMALAYHGGRVYAGGFFSAAGGQPARCVAYWLDGSWLGVSPGFVSGDSNPETVFDLHEFQGELYAGGHFHKVGNAKAASVARKTEAGWMSVANGFESVDEGAWVNEFVDFQGELVAVGRMAESDSRPVNNVARLRWGRWRPFGAGSDSEIKCAEEFYGKLYVGGHFTHIGTTASASLAAWEESSPVRLVDGFEALRTPTGVDVSFSIHPSAEFDQVQLWRASAPAGEATLIGEFEARQAQRSAHDETAPVTAFEYWLHFTVSGAPDYRSERFSVAESPIPERTALRLVGANPMPGRGDFLLALARPGAVKLEIYDARGRLVRKLRGDTLPAREHLIRWDGRDHGANALARGVYHLRLEFRPSTGDRSPIRRTLKFTLAR
jgi:hypothetical protein